MRRLSDVKARTLLVLAAALLLVPAWSGEERLPLLAADARFTVTPRPDLSGAVGPLRIVAAWQLRGRDPAFGGFSAIAAQSDRLTLLGDGGNFIQLARRGEGLVPRAAGALPAGPGTGWTKVERDSEALVVTGDRAWVAFEQANAIWRYDADLGRGQAMVLPAAMRSWEPNGGAEALARLPDGRFVAVAEDAPRRGGPHTALLFSGDPTAAGTRVLRFSFAPPPGFRPSDAAALPSGDLLVLTRRFRLPLDFTVKLVLVPRARLRAGAVAEGREVATFAGPLGYNWEGLAVTRERGRVVLWLVNDNDAMPLRRSLLLKLVVAGRTNGPPRERRAVR